MGRNRSVKQLDATDCGAACLCSVAAHYKLESPIARIRQLAGTNGKGTSLYGMIRAAENLGFDAKGIRADAQCLVQIPVPAIAHISRPDTPDHYVVIYKVSGTTVSLMDPAIGCRQDISLDQFRTDWTGVLILLMPGGSFKKGERQVAVWTRFWFLLKPHRALFIQAFVGSVVYTLLGFSTAIYLQKLTDFVFVGQNTNLLNLLSCVMVILLILQMVIASFKDVYLTRTGQLIELRLILGYYKHLLKLPQSFFDGMQVGEIMSRVKDAMKIRNFINSVILNLTVNVLILFFSFALMFTLYWKLALIILWIIPFYMGIYLMVNSLNKRVERRVMEAAAMLEGQLVESLQTIRTIKLFGLEAYASLRMETRFIRFLKKGYFSALNHIFSAISTSSISGLFTIILLWAGSVFVIQGEMTPGELLSFYAIVGYFTSPVSRLINANKEIQKALIAADRLFEIMDLRLESTPTSTLNRTIPPGAIVFKDVSFGYTGRQPLFKNMNLHIPENQITAIVGASGSGKSSLIHLLHNLYPLAKGMVSIGGNDIRYFDKAALREHIGVVPQDIHLFSGDFIENIAPGECSPELEKITTLCDQLGLLGFIESLPRGLHAYIGENGALLSGGQKQRVAVARALYKDPSVLILDEATSNLDARSESLIRNAVGSFRDQSKTVIMITHRLGTAFDADKIVVLDEGKVVEEGRHEHLLFKKAQYYRLWQQQLHPTAILTE